MNTKADANGVGNVLHDMFTGGLEREVNFVLDLLPDVRRDGNTSRGRETFDARRDVDAISIEAAVLDDYVADSDTNPKLHPPILRKCGISGFKVSLDRDS